MRKLLICILLCGCVNFKSDYGYYINIDDIQAGASGEQVEEAVGKPSYFSKEKGEKVWYYISTEVNRYIINPSYNSRVVKVVFNDEGKVTNVEEVQQEGLLLPMINSIRTQGEGIFREKNMQERIFDSVKQLQPSLSPQ